ncbi:MAG: GGDEF domain-containing protein [Piscinibacter sp.]
MSLSPLRIAISDSLRSRLTQALSGEIAVVPPLAQDSPAPDLHIMPAEQFATDAARHTAETAFVVFIESASDIAVIDWLRDGAADVLTEQDIAAPGLARRLRIAAERHRLDLDARHAYSTDLATGLPHRQQLVEHMSHLIALRERQPAPMAVLVLRIEGLESATARLGREAADVLRRKLAVRLRAGVRASDVVAALGDDCYAVLLAALLAPGDAAHVGAKLLTALRAPFQVAGQEAVIAAALGIALHLQDGAQPEALLARASALAAAAPAEGRHSGAAANDG